MTAGNLMMTFLESVGADHCILSSPISSLPACEHWLKFKKGYQFFFFPSVSRIAEALQTALCWNGT